ncbi:MAG: hypothetical protein WCV59_04050 [Parcubacteria group bacterium]|jgi:hypothetical protein
MNRLNQAFKSIKSIEPPVILQAAILCNIKKAKARQIRQELVFSEVGLISSILAIFYTFFAFGQTLLKSEFWNMMSLSFTDAGVVLANWHDYLYSMMETFPVLTLAIILLPIFVLLVSVSSYLNLSNKNNFKHTHPGVCA